MPVISLEFCGPEPFSSKLNIVIFHDMLSHFLEYFVTTGKLIRMFKKCNFLIMTYHDYISSG